MATRRVPALLARLNRLNKTAVFLGGALVVFAALAIPGLIGAVALLLLAAGLIWLLSLTWRFHSPRTLILRMVVLTLLLTLAVAKLA